MQIVERSKCRNCKLSELVERYQIYIDVAGIRTEHVGPSAIVRRCVQVQDKNREDYEVVDLDARCEFPLRRIPMRDAIKKQMA